MTLSIEPLHALCIIEPAEEEAVTPGGIMLPQKSRQRPESGMVLAVGPGERRENGDYVPLPFEVGDTVFFNDVSGYSLRVDGRDVRILREGEIFAKKKKPT